MAHRCPGEGCEAVIDDSLRMCTECREFEQSVAANLHDIQAKLAAHSLWAEWQESHPESKEDV